MPFVSRVVTALLAVSALTTAAVGLVPADTASAAPTATASGSRYTPLDTARVFAGTVGTTPVVVPIAGRAGVPADATAVVVNVETEAPTAAGYVRITPAGTDARVALQEFPAGRTISNLATVKLASGGVQVKVSAGSARVYLDVSGYYAADGGSTFTPLPTVRVASPTVGTTPVPVPLAGRGGVPDDATAVVVNVETNAPTADGYTRLTPLGRDASVATQEFTAGRTVSNLAIVRLVDGAAQVRLSRGTATVFMDVAGYYSASSTGSVFVPIDTTRIETGTLGNTPRTVRATGTGGVPGTATAVVANVEVQATSSDGYLRVTPAGQDASVAAQVFRAGEEVSAAVITKVTGSTAARAFQAKVSRGTAVDYVDVSGYFLDGTSASGTGVDVSWPQCGSALPGDAAFAVVGVNGGLANNTNPCLSSQLAWAAQSSGGTSQPTVQLYVNTANPGSRASVWPTSNTLPNGGGTVPNPYGTCTGGYDAACSYVYGWTRAVEDATVRGVSDPSAYRWWLDVETEGTWQADRTQNRADLEGMATYLTSRGAQVGLYSTGYQWNTIVGSVPTSSPLYPLPSWIATGAPTLAAAQQACSGTPLTGGSRIEVTQYVVGGFDRNASCV
ncbi:hypothetical protein C1N91_10400 [Curtobacterium sp. SGAir0471]|uniref:hypothetical protein n=1 Tax=Curtobacterium sp. SGAir0471 TaxID=2070337 RepID=UPI0010CCD3E0|nr:hypothetical protein [Curtobacterium sp. SGAir0471]QCR43883.1 hypothetical protein C1N91_10400 [Curtobacterium sp. SGAir0471]